jgi:hypothetical protein
MDQHEERMNPKFVLGGEGFLDFVFLINKNVDCKKTRKGTSQSGDPFVLVLFKCFHNIFTRCPRFSALFV